MAKLTPQEIADKQVKRAMQAVGDYTRGVEGVTVSPTAEAAKKKDKYLAGVQQAVEDGAYEDGLNSVSKEDWIAVTVAKGRDRYAKGVEQAKDKIVDFQTAIAPHRDRVSSSVRSMPNDTFEERMARMDANARGMHEFKYRKRSRRR
jgi:hypothetical protein